MDFKIFIFFCLSVFVGVYGKNDRIIGGEQVERITFPFVVSLRASNINKHFCAGSIVMPDAVLTSASCLYKREEYFSRITVHAGATNITDLGSVHRIKRATLHPDFTGDPAGKDGYHNDIAVIEVEEPFELNEFQNFISFPTEMVMRGDDVTLCGWGLTSFPSDTFPSQLHCVSAEVEDCNDFKYVFAFEIQNDQICTYKQRSGACIGDGGGPVIKNGQIVGIISYSKPCATFVPDLHTDVYSHIDFILHALNENYP